MLELTSALLRERLDRFYGPVEPPYRCHCGREYGTLEEVHRHVGFKGYPHAYRKGYRR